ncbi:MAG: hypothetical protein HS117_12275 [Verrucomicrobiaceae bacterium]|nr:hypothetical protein [Verrucomicrobiaceae bacterium]
MKAFLHSAFGLLALTSLTLGQGSLTPPGPPGVTMKTLDEVQPRTPINSVTTPGDSGATFKITQPGSYVLTGNLTPASGKHGIQIVLATSGRVEIDLMGFTINGANAGAGKSGIRVDAGAGNDTACSYMIKNGSLRGFSAANIKVDPACLGDTGTHEVGHWSGLTAVETSGRLTMTNCRIQDPTGSAIVAGAESSFTGLEIRDSSAGPEPLIVASGGNFSLDDVLVSSVSTGNANQPAILLGPGSRVRGLTARFSGGTYTGTVLGTTSGFSEVSGLNVEFLNVTAAAGVSSFTTSVQYPYELTSSQGPYQIKAVNSTFSTAVGVMPSGLASDDYCPRIVMDGTTTTPAALSLTSDNFCPLFASVTMGASVSITDAVIKVSGSGNTIRANITGMPGGSTGIRFLSGSGNTVEGSTFVGRGDSAITAVRLDATVTNTLVRNNRGSRWFSGSVMVSNLGDNTNAIAPVANSTNLGTNSNPMSNFVQ